MKSSGGPSASRRETRSRKVSQRMAVVDETTRRQAAQSRLDALEQDNAADGADPFGLLDDDDDEFVLGAGSDRDGDGDELEAIGGRPSKGSSRKKKKRKLTRGALTGGRAQKSFARLVEESGIEDAPEGDVNYLTAAAGPSAAFAPRKFCSVCGFTSGYTCARCGSRYCSRRCFTVHTETRCLKFMA